MPKNTLSLKRTAQILLRANDEKDLVKVLEDLLTPGEVQDLAERILIVEALLTGKPQREVAKKLGVSISKVTRGSQLLQYGNGALKKLLLNE